MPSHLPANFYSILLLCLLLYSHDTLYIVLFLSNKNTLYYLSTYKLRWGWGLTFHGVRVSALQDEKALETDGGDGCTTLWMHLTPLNWHLKMVKMVHYVYLTIIFKKNQNLAFVNHTQKTTQNLLNAAENCFCCYKCSKNERPGQARPIVIERKVFSSWCFGGRRWHWFLSLRFLFSFPISLLSGDTLFSFLFLQRPRLRQG